MSFHRAGCPTSGCCGDANNAFAAKRLTRNAAQQPIKQQNGQNKHCINFQIFGSKRLAAMQQFCCIAFAPRRSSASRSTMLLLFNDDGTRRCLLSGVKRTFPHLRSMSVIDPKRTWVCILCCDAVHSCRPKIVLDFREGGSRLGR